MRLVFVSDTVAQWMCDTCGSIDELVRVPNLSWDWATRSVYGPFARPNDPRPWDPH